MLHSTAASQSWAFAAIVQEYVQIKSAADREAQDG